MEELLVTDGLNVSAAEE